MKRMIVMGCLLGSCFFWVQCKSQKPAANGDASTSTSAATPSLLYDTDWKLVSLNGESIDTASLNKRPGIRFDKAQHRVSGNGGCNGMGGSYTVTGDKLHFSPLISTKMACPGLDVENKYFKALEQVTSFDVSEGRLELKSNSGTVAIFGTN